MAESHSNAAEPADSSLEHLIENAKDGDRVATGKLLHHYRPFLKFVAERTLGSNMNARMDASDVVQETQFEAYQAIAQFKGETVDQLAAWLKRILKNNIANAVRDNRAAKRAVDKEANWATANRTTVIPWIDSPADSKTPSVQFLDGEKAFTVLSALRRLPEEQQIAVRMRYLEGESVTEIAGRLGRSTQAAAGLIKRGLRRLREIVPPSTWS